MINNTSVNKKEITLWQVGGLTFTAVLGTLLHFAYEWTGFKFFAPISGINESTWEHMKLLFFPTFIFALFQSFFFKDYSSFWQVKFKGGVLGLILIPIIFYTYNGVFGKSPDWVNISIFFISAFFEFYYEWKIFKTTNKQINHSIIYLLLLFVVALLFILFTYFPPKIPLFQDPTNGSYGVL